MTTHNDSWKILNLTGAYLPRVLLYGPPGTGKTFIAMRAGVKTGEPVYRVNMTEDTPAAELRGHYIPKGSEWVWQDGPALRAFRNGGRLVIDEITRATDDALSFTLALLDGHPITLPNSETVPMSPDMSVWATTNDSPEALTDALADRFTVRIKADTVNPDALATLPPGLARIVTVNAGDSGVTFREAAEYNRLSAIPAIHDLSDKTGEDIAARLVWQSRGRDVSMALSLGRTTVA